MRPLFVCGAEMKIVTICPDCYADTAPGFVDLIRSKWPDCAYEIVFVANKKRLKVDVPVYNVRGDDMAFGWRIRKFLRDNYTDEHLLFMMSDYFISGVRPPLVARAHELCAIPHIRHVRLRPMPHPPIGYAEPNFGRIDKRAIYSLSLQPGIWESQVLYDLCRDNENPWQTEMRGSKRVKDIRGTFLSTTIAAISHKNYIKKGQANAVEWVRQHVSPECWPDTAREND